MLKPRWRPSPSDLHASQTAPAYQPTNLDSVNNREGKGSKVLLLDPVSAAWNTVARFDDYETAQRAVDRLSDDGFPVEKLDIVGSDVRLVERVTGRLTRGRAASAGALSGLAMLAMDVFVLHRKAHEVSLREADVWSAVWIGIGLAFGGLIWAWAGGGTAREPRRVTVWMGKQAQF